MDVIKTAEEEGHLHNDAARKAMEQGDGELTDFVRENMYEPDYKPLVHLPVGVLE